MATIVGMDVIGGCLGSGGPSIESGKDRGGRATPGNRGLSGDSPRNGAGDEPDGLHGDEFVRAWILGISSSPSTRSAASRPDCPAGLVT
jgi:hypothetical protein